MLITDIKKKRGHLFDVILDSGESFVLDQNYLTELSLKKGDEITEAQIKCYLRESDYKRAFSRGVWYVTQGDISKKSLLDKLKKAGFIAENCQKAVDRMCELSLINDQEYALRLAEKLLTQCVSIREATQKMQQRGISRDVCAWALEQFECDPRQQIRALINKKYRTKLTSPDNTKKVFAALQRKGFNYSDIKSVLKDYNEEIIYGEE